MHTLGIHMGNHLIGPAPSNPKGHFENLEWVTLNDQLLQSQGFSWHNPPKKMLSMPSIELENKMKQLLLSQKKPIWGLKDPRTILTFNIWKPLLEEISEVVYIFLHRDYSSSLRSLSARDNISLEQADQILNVYKTKLNHCRIHSNLSSKQIIDVQFEELIKDPKPFVSEINLLIGKESAHSLNEVRSFLDARLKHY